MLSYKNVACEVSDWLDGEALDTTVKSWMDRGKRGKQSPRVKVRACALSGACRNVYDIKKLMTAQGSCCSTRINIYTLSPSACICSVFEWRPWAEYCCIKHIVLGKQWHLSDSLQSCMRHNDSPKKTWMIHMEHNLWAMRFFCIRNQSSHVPQQSSPATLWAARSNARKIMLKRSVHVCV